jgi:hypothetical protein
MRNQSPPGTDDLENSVSFCSLDTLLSVTMICLIAGIHSTADAQVLLVIGKHGDSVDLAVPDAGDIPLAFNCTPTGGISFDIDFGSFLSEDDQTISVSTHTSGESDCKSPTRP